MFNNERGNDFLVFQIGFSRCGSHSLQHIISQAGCHGQHYIYRHHKEKKTPYEGKLIYDIFMDNLQYGNHPIMGLDGYSAFFDVKKPVVEGYISRLHFFHDFFPLLEKCYPKAKFILNTRREMDWVSSCFYVGGPDRPYEKQKKKFAVNRGVHPDKVEDYLLDRLRKHNKRVRDYFVGNKQHKLLDYHLNNDKPEKMKKFLADLIR